MPAQFDLDLHFLWQLDDDSYMLPQVFSNKSHCSCLMKPLNVFQASGEKESISIVNKIAWLMPARDARDESPLPKTPIIPTSSLHVQAV